MDHHEFSPSRLEQFRVCPGSYKMQLGIERPESEYAKEGTRLHEAVATRNVDGLDDEQTIAVQKCLDFLDSFIHEGDEVYSEQKVEVKDTDGLVLTFGTADIIIRHAEGDYDKPITIIDWKFGWNPVKNVNENIQLATYAVGAMMKYGANSCDCWVFQPRINHKSHHCFMNAAAIVANIQSIIKRATSERMVLNATEESCRYCAARLNCPAFRLAFQRLTACKSDYDLSDIPTLVSLYDASKGVKSLIGEIENEVKKVIEEKGQCGRYVFQVTDGAREVKDLNALYATVKDYLTQREFNDVCKVTLGKLENAVAEKLIAEANSKGEKLGKGQAKSVCYNMIASLISRGAPTKKIVEMA